MSITFSNNDNTTRIIVSDRFDYSAHNEFRAAYKDTDKDQIFVIDMNRATYMDSSALGMLLLLREHSNNPKKNISIIGCNSEIKQIFAISNFHEFFDIS